ncbi:MAG TPA: PKD domain-containing protein [Bacteroidia bacterium]|nr:PKD domain-containing protein [Bacteroidia bacterium]
MKKYFFYLIIISTMITSSYYYSQSTCANAAPFCTSTGVSFPAGVNNGSAPVGPNYGCLLSQPNPAWYYLNISTSGNIDITLTNSNNVDIDFILWGPFPNQSVMCSSIMSGTITSSGTPYIVDCSYSASATEYVNIPNAVAGEWYMLMITNFSNQSTNITATQTGGTGATNCAILCNITNMTATVSPCNPANNTYSVSGVITVTAPPSTGNLTISCSCGGTPITLNPPFSTSIPYNFAGLNSNGSNCTVTAGFSADPTCTFAVSYNAPANCSACSISASNSGNVCTGGTFSLTATTVTNATSYSWSGPNGFSSTSQNTVITNANTNASGVYTIVATTPQGTCAAITSVSVISPGTITIFQPTTICQGTNFTLTASNNSTNTVNYNWSGPNGFSSTQQNPALSNVTSNNSGVYSLTTTITSGTTQCSSTQQSTLNVIPIYTPNITPNQTVCVGDNVTFTASANGATSFTWAGPNSFTYSGQNVLLANAQTNQSGTYSVTAIFTLGNTSCSTNTVTNLAVLPKVNFTLTGNTTICPGDPILINGPSAASSFTWTNPYGQVVSNQQNLNIPNANFGMSGVYTLSVQPSGGCVSSNSININVLTPISFSVVPNDKTICKGDSVFVYASCVGGSGVYTFQWFPYTGLYFPAGFANIAKPEQTTYYTVIANDVACSQQTITSGFWINVLPLPTPYFTYDKINGCRPLCVKLNSNSQPASINTIWDFGYNLYANGDSVNYCFDKAGVYPVKVFLIDSNGCKNTVQAPFSIDVYPRPEPAIYFSPSVVTLLHNEVEFNGTYSNGPITYWHWDFGDYMNTSDTANTQNASYTYTYVSNYPVMLIATNIYGCTDTVYRNISVTEEFTMYIPDVFTPNGDGLNDVFNVRGAGFVEEGFEMLIFDRWGQLIYKTNDVYKGWDGKVKGVDAKNDVYVYKIRCFTTVQRIKKEFVGHVTLYR